MLVAEVRCSGRLHLLRAPLAHRGRKFCAVVAVALAVAASVAAPARAIVIELPYAGAPLPPPVMAGLLASADLATSTLESFFSDPVILHFKIETTAALPPTVFGYFDVHPSVTSAISYGDVAAALAADATSAADAMAVSSLQPVGALSMITNDTTAAPSLRMHVDDPFVYNTTLRLTRANQKALGLLPGADDAGIGIGADGTIVLNAGVFPLMDFDPSDGIDPGKFDMTAILMHEMLHGMGFIGGVDHIDYSSSDGFFSAPGHPHDYSGEAIFTVLDLYRYSEESVTFPDQPATGAVLDWAAGTSPIFGDNPYFSIDAGATSLALFSTGPEFGDGYQAQHWKDEGFFFGPPFGLMDPDIGPAELGMLTPLDILAMDVIGWTLIPEPSSMVLTASGPLLMVLVLARRRRRRR